MTQAQITLLIFIPLIVWRLYSRYRKLVGKQMMRPGKLWTSVILFPLFFALVALAGMQHPTALMTLLGGGVTGIALSFVGHKLTKFENQDGKLFYTPNAYLGLALMAIFVTRIAYRFFQINDMAQQQTSSAPPQLGDSPVTMFVLGLLFCYYASYSAGILMWRKRQLSTAGSQ